MRICCNRFPVSRPGWNDLKWGRPRAGPRPAAASHAACSEADQGSAAAHGAAPQDDHYTSQKSEQATD